MPRSTNPNNYESIYWDLLRAMHNEVPSIDLKSTAGEAVRVRQTFYAFITAMEKTSERLRKQGKFEISGQRQDDANAMRKYLIRIENSHGILHTAKGNDTTPVTLSFINRDLNPETQSLRDQIAKQLETLELHEPTYTDVETTEGLEPPTIDSFFEKPLEIPENKDD